MQDTSKVAHGSTASLNDAAAADDDDAAAPPERTPCTTANIDTCSWPSYFLLSWVTPLVWRGAHEHITPDDFNPLAPSMDGHTLGTRLELAFQGDIWRALVQCHRREFAFGLLPFLLMVSCSCASPFIILALLRFLTSSPPEPINAGFSLVGWLALVSTVQAFALSTAFVQSTQLATRLRVGLAVVVFRKSLRLSAASRVQTSEGDVLNLMSADVERVFMAVLVGHAFTYGATMLVSVLVILSVQTGIAGAAAILLAMVALPVTAHAGTVLGREKRKMLVHTDKRVSFMSEVIAGILTVKMQSWERHVASRLEAMRASEMVHGRHVLLLLASNAWLTFMLPPVMAVLCFGILVLTGATLTVPLVYATLTFINATILTLELVPRAVGAFAQANVSLTRINALLNLEDAPPELPAPDDVAKVAVEMVDVTVTVVQRPDANKSAGAARKRRPLLSQVSLGRSLRLMRAAAPSVLVTLPVVRNRVLDKVDLRLGQGELAVLVGRVGAGKTSLLLALLNEAEVSGVLKVCAPVAYAAQQPWIQNASLRDNITFATARVDEQLFARVVHACALEPDLALLPRGEHTEIGQRGVNLSGGQKARVALARCLYKAASDADVKLVLLDDPFSALDPHVAADVWERAVQGLLKGKTVLCALNSNAHLAAKADRLLVLHDGVLAANGAPANVLADARFAWLRDDRGSASATAAMAAAATAALTKPKGLVAMPSSIMFRSSKKLYKTEESKEGAVSMRTYWRWMRAGSRWPAAQATALLGLFAASQGIKLLMDLWLGLYASHRQPVMWPYFAACGVLVCLSLARALELAALSSRASRALHDELVRKLLLAPVNAFFDVTPSGRITNRLSSDVDHLDTRLPETLFQLLHSVFTILAALVLAVMASPYFVAVFVPIALVFCCVAYLFAKTSRQIKRLESVSRSPLFSHFAETLAGLSSVRAMRASQAFAAHNVALVNANSLLHMMFWFASRWFALRVDLIAVVAQVAVCSLVVGFREGMNPAVAGLAMVYSLQLTTTVQACTRYVIETENSMVSTERIGEMTDRIPQERAGGNKASLHGHVQFERVCARYRAGLELCLTDLSFQVAAGVRVGVVGRTGAGKSSLGQALFGMLPLESGRILLDGVDACTLELESMRRSMAVIPQTPVLFSGTVRFALDPWGDVATDAELWSALEECEVAASVRKLGGLDANVDEAGGNLSQGERQLLCVARALLRKAKLVLIDEGTASVDAASDVVVQRSIGRGFKGATVFTIAHRMHTIVESDLVLVLGNGGRCLEFGSPAELLAKQDGAFHAMWREEHSHRATELGV